MSSSKKVQARSEREAAAWFARLGGPSVSADTLADFQTWRRSPDNRAAYRRIETLWAGAKRLKGDPEIEAVADVAITNGRRRDRATPMKWLSAAAVASGVAAIAMIGAWLWTQDDAAIVTDVGEQRLLTLDDGSQVRLDTNSRINVRYDGAQRRIDLVQGQAYFSVAADGERLFTVHAGDTVITALGTRFDVRHDPGAVRVTLVSGLLQVEAEAPSGRRQWRLSPGEQVVSGSRPAEPQQVNTEIETSWTEGRLIFQETPLRAAIAEVNRYTRQPIVLEVAAYANTPVSGIFDTGDRDAFVSAAVRLFPLEARSTEDGAVRLVAGTTQK